MHHTHAAHLLRLRALAGLLLTCPSPLFVGAQTVRLNVDTVTMGRYGTSLGPSFTTQGYTFSCRQSNNGTSCGSLEVLRTGMDGRQAIFNNNYYGITTLSRSDGSPFTLFNVDLSPLNTCCGLSNTAFFQGFLASGGTVGQMFALGTPGALVTYAFGPQFTGLSSVEYRVGGFGPGGQGNVVYATDFVVSDPTTAPEPSSVFLLGSGLASVAPLFRRRAR